MSEKFQVFERALALRYAFLEKIQPNAENPLKSISNLGNIPDTVRARNKVKESIERLEKAYLLRMAKDYFEKGFISSDELQALENLRLPELKKLFKYQPDQSLITFSVPEGLRITSSSEEAFPRKGVIFYARKEKSADILLPKTAPEQESGIKNEQTVKDSRSASSRQEVLIPQDSREKKIEPEKQGLEEVDKREIDFRKAEEIVFNWLKFLLPLELPSAIKDQILLGLKRLEEAFSIEEAEKSSRLLKTEETGDIREKRRQAIELLANQQYFDKAIEDGDELRIALYIVARILSDLPMNYEQPITVIVDQELNVVGMGNRSHKGSQKRKKINQVVIPLMRVLSIENLLFITIKNFISYRETMKASGLSLINPREMRIIKQMRDVETGLIESTDWQKPQNWSRVTNNNALQALMKWIAKISLQSFNKNPNLPRGIEDNLAKLLSMIPD